MKWMDNKTVRNIVKLGSEITSENIGISTLSNAICYICWIENNFFFFLLVTIAIPSDTISLLYIPRYVCNNIVMDRITAGIYEDMPKGK